MKNIFIHIDNLPALWGIDNINLSESDAPFRGNLKYDFSIDINGNILNTSGVQIKYSNSTFTIPKPVRFVDNYGDSFLMSNPISSVSQKNFFNRAINDGIVDCVNSSTGAIFFMGELNDNAKKADGTDASTNGEAVYFEIKIKKGNINTFRNIVGIETSAVKLPSIEQGGSSNTFGLGFMFFNKSDFSLSNRPSLFGDLPYISPYYNVFNNNVSINNSFFGKLGGTFVSDIPTFLIGDNKKYRLEINYDYIALINVTDEVFLKSFHGIQNIEDLYICPIFQAIGGTNNNIDYPCSFDSVRFIDF